MKTLLTTLLLIFVNDLFGCTCQRGTIKQSYNRATVIFYGRHIQNIYSKDVFDFTGRPVHVDNFEIIKFFKGVPDYLAKNKADKGEKILISLKSNCVTQNSSSDCSFCFDSLKYYLVYCYRDIVTGQLETDGCIRTTEIINNDFTINDNTKGIDEEKELIKLAKMDTMESNYMKYAAGWGEQLTSQQNEITILTSQVDRYRFFTYLAIVIAGIMTIASVYLFTRK